jgi:6-phosphogluconolactonase
MKKRIRIFDTKEEIAEFTVGLWKDMARQAVEKKGSFIVALSGGSTPIDLYRKLSSHTEDLPWQYTHMFLVDERVVPFEDTESNFRMIKESLFDPLGISEGNVHRIPVDLGDAEFSASEYEKQVKNFFALEENEVPRFDLVILGMGKDGHTASLFPGTEAALERQRLTVPVKGKSIMHERVSITLPVINNACNVLLLISGAEKAETLKEVLEENNSPLPAAQVALASSDPVFLVDEEAAKLLNKEHLDI